MDNELPHNLENLEKYCRKRIEDYEALDKELSDLSPNLAVIEPLTDKIDVRHSLRLKIYGFETILNELSCKNPAELKAANIRDFFSITNGSCNAILYFLEDVESILTTGKTVFPSKLEDIPRWKLERAQRQMEAEEKLRTELAEKRTEELDRRMRESAEREKAEKKQRLMKQLTESGIIDELRRELKK